MVTTLLILLWSGLAATPKSAPKMDTVVQNLSAPTVETRVNALRQLATLPADTRAIERLLTALRDPSPLVRLQAAKTWGLVGNAYDAAQAARIRHEFRGRDEAWKAEQQHAWRERLLAGLRSEVGDTNATIRHEAVRTLALLGDSVARIMPPNPGCGTGVPEYLSDLTQKALYDVCKENPPLIAGLFQDANADVVYNAVCSCRQGRAKIEQLQPLLRRFLSDRRPEWRAMGINGLTWLKVEYDSLNIDMDFVKRTLHLLGDEDVRVRETMQYYCRFIHNEERPLKEAEVLRLLEEEYPIANPLTRRAILQITSGANNYLWKAALQDPDDEVRAYAITKLTSAESPLPRLYLLRQLNHANPSLHVAVSRALWYQNDGQRMELLLPLLNDPDAEVRQELIYLISKEKDLGTLALLVQVLRLSKDEDGTEANSIGNMLSEIGPPAGAEVRKLLTDADPKVRMMAADILWKVLPDEANTLLLSALKDKTAAVRANAIRLLHNLKDRNCEPELIKLLRDKDKAVRLAAIAALGELGGVEADSELTGLLNDEDDDIYEAAADAIKSLNKS